MGENGGDIWAIKLTYFVFVMDRNFILVVEFNVSLNVLDVSMTSPHSYDYIECNLDFVSQMKIICIECEHFLCYRVVLLRLLKCM